MPVERAFRLSVILALFAMVSFGQRVDLDRMYAKIYYRSLPLKPLSSEYSTFEVKCLTPEFNDKYYSEEEIISKINLAGFKKVDSEADIQIVFLSDNINVSKSEVVTRVEEAKDKTGKVTGRTTYYKNKVTYSIAASAEIRDLKTNNVLYSFRLDNYDNKYEHFSKETTNNKEAVNYFTVNKEIIYRNLIEEKYSGYFSYINNYINKNYGYPVAIDNVLFWILGSKKHPEFAAYENVSAQIEQLFKSVNAHEPLTNALEAFKPIEEHLQSIISKYTSTDKGDKKMRYSAYFNLGEIYFYMEMLDKAYEMGAKIIENDYDGKDGKKLQERVDELKDLYEKNQTNTRHFPRNFEE